MGREGGLLLGLLGGAAFLRFRALDLFPPAHYRDVALTAIDALRAAAGHPCLHYTYDEGLYSNLMALLFLVAGPSDWSVRAPGALFGVLTCWGVYRLGQALDLRRAGLWGAGLLAVSFWHVLLSRSGFRAVLLPALLAHSLALLVEGLRRGRHGRMLAAGALFGLGIHVYPSVRFAPLILPAYLAAELGGDGGARSRSVKGLALFAGGALLVAAPMLLHYLHHPEHFNFPHRVVSVFSPKVAADSIPGHLWHNLVATLLMFHLRGDANWRHNLSGAPLLDPLTGVLLLVGAVVLPGRPGARAAAALLLGWVPAMLLPNLLSVEGVPHGLRSSGTLPALALLAGVGMASLERAMARRAGERAAAALAVSLLLALAAWTSHRYFVTWGTDPRVAAAHDGAYRSAARLLLAAPPGVTRLLVANGQGFRAYGQPAEVQPFLFEMRDALPVVVGPHDFAKLALGGRPAIAVLIRRDDHVLTVIRELNPGASIEEIAAPGLSFDTPAYRID
jgi:hypothetical protein